MLVLPGKNFWSIFFFPVFKILLFYNNNKMQNTYTHMYISSTKASKGHIKLIIPIILKESNTLKESWKAFANSLYKGLGNIRKLVIIQKFSLIRIIQYIEKKFSKSIIEISFNILFVFFFQCNWIFADSPELAFMTWTARYCSNARACTKNWET